MQVHCLLLYISLPSLRDYDVKLPDFSNLFKLEWAIDSEAMKARGIIALVKSNWLVKNIETKQLYLAKRHSVAIVLVFKAGAFRF